MSKQVGRVWLARQLLRHSEVVAHINLLIGKNESASQHLSKCIYSVAMGSNDYINNYYMPAQNTCQPALHS